MVALLNREGSLKYGRKSAYVTDLLWEQWTCNLLHTLYSWNNMCVTQNCKEQKHLCLTIQSRK